MIHENLLCDYGSANQNKHLDEGIESSNIGENLQANYKLLWILQPNVQTN